jgi:hypothetical protein
VPTQCKLQRRGLIILKSILLHPIYKILQSPVHIIEIIATLVALYQLIKERSLFMLLSFIMLLCTVLVESGNKFKIYNTSHGNNWIYNIFSFIEMPFFIIIFYITNSNAKFKKLILYLGISFVVLNVLNMLFFQGFYTFASYSCIWGYLVIVVCVFLFYRDIINRLEFIQQPILSLRMFWFSIGAFVFFSSMVFLMAFFQYFLIEKKFLEFAPVWKTLSMIVNLILYSCLIISFCKKPHLA